ncbi:3-keto-5-aminohexanoate cleavage protein, partial [Achromobacter xylosoxidans]
GQLAESNRSQVERIRTILEALNLEVATPADTRAKLGLKGGDNVAF